MFTGIVTGIGIIVDAKPLGGVPGSGLRLAIGTPRGYLDGVATGDSIALNGACMTVVSFDAAADRFEVDISSESLARTTALDHRGGRVNLELALRAGDRLGGHLVSGHVDGIGAVERVHRVGESTELVVACPPELAGLIAVKGSLVVNGVSLTVNGVDDRSPDACRASLNLIPHTLEHTTLGELAAGARVNLEVDLIARYVARWIDAGRARGV